MNVSPSSIVAVAPRCHPEWANALALAMDHGGIDTELRCAHFIAQLAHESAGITRFTENLNYSAQGLVDTFPSHFPRMELALMYARDPERIANRVYASSERRPPGGPNDLGNGDEASGDGWLYRGRGVIQITGRSNYAQAAAATGMDLVATPDIAAQPSAGAAIAVWYWNSRNCNLPADADDIRGVTRKVNGKKMIGLDDRMKWLSRAKLVTFLH